MVKITQEAVRDSAIKTCDEYADLSFTEATLRFVAEATAMHSYLVNVRHYTPNHAFDRLIQLMQMYKDHNIEYRAGDDD